MNASRQSVRRQSVKKLKEGVLRKKTDVLRKKIKELPRKTEGLRNNREEIWKMNQERQNFILIKNFSVISLEGLFLCVEQVKNYC